MADVSLTLLVLKTRQVEQLRAFYQTLGVNLVEEQHGKGPVHFAGRAGAVVIEVYPLPDDGSPVDSSTRLGFNVENVAEGEPQGQRALWVIWALAPRLIDSYTVLREVSFCDLRRMDDDEDSTGGLG